LLRLTLLWLTSVLSGLIPRQRRHRLVVVDSNRFLFAVGDVDTSVPVRGPPKATVYMVQAWLGVWFGVWLGHGSVYGFKLHTFVSTRGEVLAYRLRLANQQDYRAAKGMLEGVALGSPLKIGDKAYTLPEFITPPKNNAKRPDHRWKPEYHRLRKRVETLFSQLTQAHIRSSQISIFIALEARVA